MEVVEDVALLHREGQLIDLADPGPGPVGLWGMCVYVSGGAWFRFLVGGLWCLGGLWCMYVYVSGGCGWWAVVFGWVVVCVSMYM